MSKMHLYKLKQATQFNQTVLPAGTVVGSLQIDHDCVDPCQLLSMMQYQQLSVESIEFDPDEALLQSDALPGGPSVDLPQSGSADGAAGLSGELSETDDSDSVDSVHEIASLGIEAAIVETLIKGGLDTIEKLTEYVNSGKSLMEIKGIGATRVAKILAAIGQAREPSVTDPATEL